MKRVFIILAFILPLASSCGIQEIKDLQQQIESTQAKVDSISSENDSLAIRISALEAYPDTIQLMGNDLIWFYNQQLRFNFQKDSNLVRQIFRPRPPANQGNK